MTQLWRVMGMWRDGREFLVVMGHTRADCTYRLTEALADYDLADLGAIESLWLEHFEALTEEMEPRWIPRDFVSKRRFLLQRLSERRRLAVA